MFWGKLKNFLVVLKFDNYLFDFGSLWGGFYRYFISNDFINILGLIFVVNCRI